MGIYINDEINALAEGLQEMEYILKPGGRGGILSYHSLEDKLVKYFLKYASGIETYDQICDNPTFSLLQKKVIKPSKEEVKGNLRSRSARLRVGVRTEEKRCVGQKFFTQISPLKTTWQC